MVRDRIYYSVGSEHSPTDPFGRSEVVIEVNGQVISEDTVKVVPASDQRIVDRVERVST